MKSKYEIFIETDVFMHHLYKNKPGGESVLQKCLKLFDCFTSVINASEIFSVCPNAKMIDGAKHSFYGVGVLGIPFRYSLTIAEVSRKIKKKI